MKEIADKNPADALLYGSNFKETFEAAKSVAKVGQELQREKPATPTLSEEPDSRQAWAAISASEAEPPSKGAAFSPTLNVSKYAGRLKYFTKAWRNITDNKDILSWIQGYELPLISTPTQASPPAEPLLTTAEATDMQEAIESLILS
ncbi:unnamed protein product, partial [Allacma fusca]